MINHDTDPTSLARRSDDLARQILATVNPLPRSIATQAGTIRQRAADVDARVAAISGQAKSILDAVNAIAATSASIRGSPDGTTPGTGVAGINGRVDAVIAAARGISDDLAAVFAEVDPAGQPGPSANLYEHVASIDNTSLIDTLSDLLSLVAVPGDVHRYCAVTAQRCASIS